MRRTSSILQPPLRKITSKRSPGFEIGANNGLFLKNICNAFDSNSYIIGVEPSENCIAEAKDLLQEASFDWHNNYFNEKTCSNIIQKHGIIDIIIARHVFEHTLDPNQFIELASRLMDENSLFILESPSIETIIKNQRYDNISFSHIHHISIYGLSKLLQKHGLKIINHQYVDTDGGSNLFYIAHEMHEAQPIERHQTVSLESASYFLEEGLNKKKKMLREYVLKATSDKSENSIAGYGAGAKGQHLIHLFELTKILDCVIDNTPYFDQKYVPSTNIRITNPSNTETNNFYIINLAPTHYEAISNLCRQA